MLRVGSGKGMIWFVLVLRHINHCKLLMPNPFIYIYIYEQFYFK